MRPALVLILALGACTSFPELERSESDWVADAPYPDLLPLEAVLTGPVVTATPEVVGSVEARVARLRARAARLSGPVVPDRIRARMARGIDSPF